MQCGEHSFCCTGQWFYCHHHPVHISKTCTVLYTGHFFFFPSLTVNEHTYVSVSSAHSLVSAHYLVLEHFCLSCCRWIFICNSGCLTMKLKLPWSRVTLSFVFIVSFEGPSILCVFCMLARLFINIACCVQSQYIFCLLGLSIDNSSKVYSNKTACSPMSTKRDSQCYFVQWSGCTTDIFTQVDLITLTKAQFH